MTTAQTHHAWFLLSILVFFCVGVALGILLFGLVALA